MASVVGTPQNIASGANYTVGSGSNRVFVAVVKYKYGGGNVTLTNVVYNSITRTPIPGATGNDTANGDRCGIGFCVFKESELASGASSVTATLSGGAGTLEITCYTIDGVDQSTTVRTGNTSNDTSGATVACALASIVIGDIVIGGMTTRNQGGGTYTINNSWTSDKNADNGDGGQFIAAHKTAVATTETFSVTQPGADDNFMGALALMPLVSSGLATTLNSSSKITAALSSGISLASTLSATAKLVSALAATSVFATLLAANPTITPTLSTGFNLQTSLPAVAKLPNTLTNWTTVTLAGTLFNGNGSAISPYLWTTGPAPTVGTTLYYDATYITIYTDAQTSSSVGTATTLIQWFDGTQWWSAELAYTPGEVTFLGAKSSLINDLTTFNSMSSTFNSSPRLINNLNTTISLASLNKSIASLPNALDSGITFASALNSTSSLPNALSTSIAAQTLLASKASIAGSFSLLMNATLSSASKLTNNLSTSIPLLTSFNGYSSMTSAFALPDMALQSVLRIAVSMPNELGTGIALQTNEVSTSRLTAAMSSGIPLATVLNSTLGFSSTLGGAPAVFQTALVAKAALLSDLYAYKAITTTLVSSGTVVSSLGTTLALQCEFSSTSSLLNDLIVLPVELPPAWRCVSIGSATHDAINGQALPDKDPEDVLDYGIILSDEATELDPLKVLTVSIESCSPDESPVSLVIDNALWAMSNPTSGVVDSIVFWLSGGTVGTTYVLRIEADDTETVPHIRVLVRRVTITVAKQ